MDIFSYVCNWSQWFKDRIQTATFNNDYLVNETWLAQFEIECEYTLQAWSGLPPVPPHWFHHCLDSERPTWCRELRNGEGENEEKQHWGSRFPLFFKSYQAPLFLWQSHNQPLLLYPIKCTLLQVVPPSRLCSSTLLTWYYLQCLKLNAKGNICNPLIRCFLITPNAAPFISDRAVLSLKVFLLNWALQCYVIEGIVSSTSPCLDQ